MKKIIRNIIAFTAIASTLTACGKKGNTIYSNPQVLEEVGVFPFIKDEYKGQVKLNVMGACNSATDIHWENNKFFTRMSEATGLEYTFNVFGDGMYDDKKATVLSTRVNIPDVFIKGNLTNYDEVTYGGKVLRPLNDLIDGYAPHIKALLDNNKIIKKSITTTDGNIYALPTIYTNLPNNTTTNMRGFFWINKTYMNGAEMPKTPAEFKTLLQNINANYLHGSKGGKDSKHALAIAGIDDLLRLFNLFGLELSNYWVQGGEDGKLIFGPTTDEFKNALDFIKSLIDEGLMNNDYSTTTANDIMTYGSRGDQYACFVQASPQYVVGASRLTDFTTLDPMSPTGENAFWAAKNPVQRGCFALTYECQYPEAAIRMMDALYDTSLPYGLWSSIGKEGEEWEWIDDEHTQWKSTVAPDAPQMKTTIIQTGDGMPYAVDEEFWGKQVTETDTYTRPLRNRQMTFGKVGYPDVYFNSTDLREMSDLAADINKYITNYINDYIRGSSSVDTWENFKAFRKLGLDRYLEILQDRYDDFMAAVK